MFSKSPPQADTQQVTLPPRIDIVIPSDHELSLDFDSWPSPTVESLLQDAKKSQSDQVAAEETSDQGVIDPATGQLATKPISDQVTTEPTSEQVTIEPTTDQIVPEPTPVQVATKPIPIHAESSDHCGFSVKRSFSKRFQKILVTTRLKRRKPKARMPIDQSDEDPRQPEEAAGPDEPDQSDEPDEPSRIPGARGRSIASKMPSHMRQFSLHDDGQGCWTDEFGYIYRSGIDMSISHLSIGEESRVPRAPDLPDDRVDSRVPAGSLGPAAGFSEKQDATDDGAPGRAPRVSEGENGQAVLEDQRVFELEAIEAVLESHGVSELEDTPVSLGSHDVAEDGNDDIEIGANGDAESSCCDDGGCCSDAGDE